MYMRYLALFFFAIGLMSCKSQKYQLEENPILVLKEGYYNEIPPGIREGNIYIKATLKFNEFDKEKIKLIGFYFRDNYIPMKQVSDSYSIEGSVLKKKKDSLAENKIPFEIKPSEVVLSYEVNKKLKHAKYIVKRKISFDDIPM